MLTDNAKHIVISAGMSIVLCVVLRLAGESLWMTFYAALMSMLVGVMKELYDCLDLQGERNHWDWNDIKMDAVGSTIGCTIASLAWLI